MGCTQQKPEQHDPHQRKRDAHGGIGASCPHLGSARVDKDLVAMLAGSVGLNAVKPGETGRHAVRLGGYRKTVVCLRRLHRLQSNT